MDYILQEYLLSGLMKNKEAQSHMTCLEKTYNFVTCKSSGVFPTPYDFHFNGHDSTKENEVLFESNFVKTSKYTLLTFLPVALLLQFKRIANIYFLVISILQSISILSPLSPESAWAPLIFVMTISMIRQGYEDYQRHQTDNQMNFETMTNIRTNGKFEEVQWCKVSVGDIIRVQQEELFPADMILLATSSEGGVAFIQTASLDGEKNLKPRNAYAATIPLAEGDKLDAMKGQWFGIPPDKELHKFSSKMNINGEMISIQGDKQLLYRGSRLKNTKWVYGVTIYTGRNSKIMLNSESSSVKMSQVQAKVNKILGMILLAQFACCLIVAIFAGFYRESVRPTSSYILWSDTSTIVDGILKFLTYFVLINTMIPISLVVSIEVVKIAQSVFIGKDKLMYSQLRKKFVDVKSSSLNEELGQIEYVFSDKTGTLTMNIMQFKIAVIGQKLFGDLGLLSNDPNAQVQEDKGFRDDRLKTLLATGQENQPLVPKITIRNQEGGQEINFQGTKELAEEYFQCLGLAHEVISEKDKKGNQFYQGPSPDEITLVDAAKSMEFQFIQSTQQHTKIKIRGVEKTYDLLEVFAFNSDRKRMSVLVRSGGAIKMYTKGADSIIKQRLSQSSKLNLDVQLNQFSRMGLRTLLIAMRVISEQEYSNFKKAVEGLPSANKEEAQNQLISNLEKNLYLIGATAVLDRLQDQVPETIRDLIRANIKVWMLTGDKMQTAENIAKSCNLIQNHFEIIRYLPPKDSQILPYLKTLVSKSNELTQQGAQKAFLIEGSDLTPIIASDQCQTELANMAKNCEAVVCCRLLPIQKAEVVSIVREKLNKITLAIGDGANDVPMIKTAHIGIGLFGQEGMGAVQASDYALPEFRMLWRLLLVHGRWNYMRISEMILYFFYKNMLFTIPQLIIAFYCGFSGQTIFDDNYIALYNLAFTSLPLVIRAVLQQDINYVLYKSEKENNVHEMTSTQLYHSKRDKVEKYLPGEFRINKFFYRLFPKIYFIGQENCIFNYTNFSFWILEGIVEAILITFFSLYIIGNLSVDASGIVPDFWLVGLVIYSSVVMVVTLKLMSHTKFWSILLIVSIVLLSIGPYLGYMWISNVTLADHIIGTTYIAWTTLQPYLVVLFCCCLVLTLDGLVLYIDFERGGYASKMRNVVDAERQITRSELMEHSMHLTEGLTVVAKGE